MNVTESLIPKILTVISYVSAGNFGETIIVIVASPFSSTIWSTEDADNEITGVSSNGV